jgi:hypothetical protein
MKRNLFNRLAVMIITAVLTLTAADTFAASTKEPIKIVLQQLHPDTPYLAIVQINRSGAADTPYVSFSVQPQFVYTQVNNLLLKQPGLFYVLISFVTAEGKLVTEDDYYVDHTY